MGCCCSDERNARAADGPEIVTFDYNPSTGAVVPVRKVIQDVPTTSNRPMPSQSMTDPMMDRSPDNMSMVLYSPQESAQVSAERASFANSFSRGQSSVLTRAQEQYILAATTADARVSRLEEVEEIKRGEIYGAFLVTSKMLDLARRRVRPVYRVTGRRLHADPLASAPTLVIHSVAVEPSPAKSMPPPPDAAISDAAAPEMDLVAEPEPAFPSTTEASETATTQRLQVLDIHGLQVPVGYISKCTALGNAWDFLSRSDAGSHLSQGDSYFGFACKPVRNCTEEDRVQMATIVNITGFEDELRDNGCPVLDVNNEEQMKPLTVIMVKAMYVLPGFDLSNISRELLATVEYQKSCQPGKPKFWEDFHEPYTFRETKPLVGFVYSIVIQLRVHEITDPAQLASFEALDGLRPEKAILLERTKRDKTKVDSTVKCKSVLLYYRVTGGTLVTNITVVVNSSIPRVVASLVNNFGSSGAKEVGETAVMTRAYLLGKFGDCRHA